MICILALQGCAGTPRQTVIGPPVPDGCGDILDDESISLPDAHETREFVAYYKSDVLGALKQIHRRPYKEKDRYLVLSKSEHSYVQCILHNHDAEILCEAASGFYGPRHLQAMSSRVLESIAQQGFSMDGSKGNFTLNLLVEKPETYCRVADLMLETLYRGYGVRKGELKMSAAFVFETEHIPHDYQDR